MTDQPQRDRVLPPEDRSAELPVGGGGPVRRAERQPTRGPRAAQIQVALDVLERNIDQHEAMIGLDTIAARIVDAVHAAGGPAESIRTLSADHLKAAINALAAAGDESEPERYRTWYSEALTAFQAVHAAGRDGQDETYEPFVADPGERDVVELDLEPVTGDPLGLNRRDRQAEARGWAKAVQALRDELRYQTWWSALPEEHPDYGYWSANPRRQFADYLEAVGPDGTTEVVHRCPVWNSAITPCCGRTPFELPRLDRLATDPAQVTCGAQRARAALPRVLCTCPQVDVSRFTDGPRNPPTVKGLDPNCPVCSTAERTTP